MVCCRNMVVCTFLILAIVACVSNSHSIPDKFSNLVDSELPRDEYLSPIYKRSSAYVSVNDRLPEIIQEAIEDLRNSKSDINNKYGQAAEVEVDHAISSLGILKTELENNEVMRNITSEATDAKFYNNYLIEESSEALGPARYYYVKLALTQGYVYRRMREVFESSKHLGTYDQFEIGKRIAFNSSLPLIKRIAGSIMNLTNSSKDADKEEFIKLLKLNIWGNRCDLSHGSCAVDKEGEDLLDVDSMNAYLLSDETEKIWGAISDGTVESSIVDIVMDNVAYELFTDLCLADYMISRNLAKQVRFYVKVFPWFVSDTMRKDIHWMISQLISDKDENVAHLGTRWSDMLKNAAWVIEENNYFTLPIGYAQMKRVKPDLYKKLSQSKLILFKGDLNYRKLLNGRNWDHYTSIENALEGFYPSKIAALRTLKSEPICGLTTEAVQSVANVTDWRVSGQYGVIQYCNKVQLL